MSTEIYERINELEKELNLPEGFYNKLSEDDDWSFIIKLHSLIEAAVTHTLIIALGDNRLEGVIAALQLGHKKTGKLAFVVALDLLHELSVKLIIKLSDLRNILVHKISNVQFNLEEYVNNLNKAQLNEFVEIFGFGFTDALIESYDISVGKKMSRQDFFKAESKINIWVAAMHCLDTLYLQKENALVKAKLNKTKLEIAEAVTKNSDET
jgi:hypothetical protein